MSIEKKISVSKYFNLKLWARESGALWLPFEHERISQFSKIKANEKASVSGYVKWISNSVFALVPTLFSNQVYLVCINYTDLSPAENAFVTVSGNAKFDNIRKITIRKITSESRRFSGDLIIEVYDWINAKSGLEIPKLNFNYKDFKLGLTSRVEGLEPQIRDFLAFSAISTPAFLENTGGINLTLYDSTKSGLPMKVVRELKKIIPQDMGSTHKVETGFGRFAMRYKYAFVSEDADKPLSKQTEDLLSHKISRLLPEDSEISMSMFSKNSTPISIQDPPCSLSDVPTVIPENTSINRSRSVIDQFDALKYMIVSHMKTPIVEDIQVSQEKIANDLEKIVESYGLDASHLTKYGFLNASYNARPSSVIRECLAFARASDVNIVNPELVSKVFDNYFKWNFDFVYDIWVDLLSTPLTSKENLASLNVQYREVIRIIRKYHSTGEPGAKRGDIIREARTPQNETERLIDDCLNEGLIYEPMHGIYRLTRELA
jgi:hypothetical protein